MENLSLNNHFCVSTIGSNICEDNLDATYLKKSLISEISNFETFIKTGFDDIDKFYELKFDLGYTDVFFFIGKKEKITNLELFYGDLEKCNVDFNVGLVPQIKKFYLGVLDFLKYFVEENNSKIYKNVLNKEYIDRIVFYEKQNVKFSKLEKIIFN